MCFPAGCGSGLRRELWSQNPFASTAEAASFTERPNRKGKGSKEAVLFILFRSGWEFVS